MSDDKVVSIRGGVVPAVSSGNETVAEMLRGLLERAEAGEVIGFGYVAVHRDLTATCDRGGTLGSWSGVGAAEGLKTTLLRIAMGEGE